MQWEAAVAPVTLPPRLLPHRRRRSLLTAVRSFPCLCSANLIQYTQTNRIPPELKESMQVGGWAPPARCLGIRGELRTWR